MKIFTSEGKWANVAGDAGFVDDVLIVGGDNNRQIVVKDAEGEVLGVLSKEGIELNKAKFNFLEAQNIVQTQTAITYYINAETGDDNNDGLSASKAFKNIHTAVSLLKNKKLIKSCKIEIAKGTYNENLWIEGISGAGILTLNFSEGVVINGLISVAGCSNMITLAGNKTILNQTEDSQNYAIGANFSTHLRIIGFNINAQPKTQHGVLAYRGATVSIKDSSISNITNTTAAAVTAYENSQVYIDNCTGSNNYRSIWSASGSMVTINNKIPFGNNVNQQSTGQIFGTATPTTCEGVTPTPPTITKTATFSPNGFRFWRTVINKWQDGIYMGDFSKSTGGSGTGGNNTGCFLFDVAAIRKALSGKTIVSAKIALQRKTSGGYDSTVTPELATVNTTGTGSAPTIVKNYGALSGFTKGQSKTLTIPNTVITDLIANTNVKGLALHRTDKKQYSIWENICTITVTYKEPALVLAEEEIMLIPEI